MSVSVAWFLQELFLNENLFFDFQKDGENLYSCFITLDLLYSDTPVLAGLVVVVFFQRLQKCQ